MTIKFIVSAAFLLLLQTEFRAQNTYFVINGKTTVAATEYAIIRNSFAKKGRIEEFTLKTIQTKDSVVHYVALDYLFLGKDGTDYTESLREKIGTRFPIEQFVDSDAQNFKKNYLEGKPTLINFFSVNCPGSISEIKTLNGLKEKCYEHENEVNFFKEYFCNFKRESF